MTAGPTRCGKCGGELERGFVPEAREYSAKIDTWVEGEPKTWLGVALSLHGRRRRPIQSWRCRRCGFLENYAPDR